MAEDFFELIDKLAKVKRLAEGTDLLKLALKEHGLGQIAYAVVNLPTKTRATPLVASAYTPEWQRHYTQSDYVNIDPIVRAGMGGVLPVDWATIQTNSPIVKKFFGEAQEFGIGSSGLSFPIRGRHGEFAIFSVAARECPANWEALKRKMARELMLLAYSFHDWALRAEGVDQHDFLDALSTREKDCLRWRAMGKSDWDISHLLSISERTVKFHLENARAKLGATNTVHAVAIAVGFGIIVTQ